jgi:hypothetical protein
VTLLTPGQSTSKAADYGRESFPDDSAVMFRSIHWVSASSSEAATPTPAMLVACSNRSIKSAGTEAFTLERFGSGFRRLGEDTGVCRAAVTSMVSRSAGRSEPRSPGYRMRTCGASWSAPTTA